MMGSLGEMLLSEGLITEEQLQEALKMQADLIAQLDGGEIKLGRVLIKRRFITEEDLNNLVGKQQGCEVINLDEVEVDESLMMLFARDEVEKYCLVPLSVDETTIRVAMPDPENLSIVDELKFATGKKIIPVLCPVDQAQDIVGEYFHNIDNKTGVIQDDDFVEVFDEDTMITLEGLAQLLIEKNVITLDEWRNCTGN